jgi:hypothetical protein
MTRDWVKLTIEVDPRTEPVRGFFDDGRKGPLPFAGMLELLALLEAARHFGDDTPSEAA